MSSTEIFALSPSIRYVANYRSGELDLQQRSQVANASTGESDKYEELFVNPAVLTLVQQRGNVDCGGATFVVVGYGNFLQLVIDLPDGHVSVAFESDENPIEYVDRIREILI